jgi:hypothetical protein
LHAQGRYDGYSDAEASKKKLLKDVFKKVTVVAVGVIGDAKWSLMWLFDDPSYCHCSCPPMLSAYG